MQFKDVVGQEKIKAVLVKEAKNERISHAQMFLGEEGCGKLPIAMAFAQYLLCENPSKNDSCGSCTACSKVNHLTHPDVHFVYPVVKSATDKVSVADDRREQWNRFILQNPYCSLNMWQEYTGEMSKNAQIGVQESRSILKKLSLKSYSGKFKIMIVWLPEKMNNSAANKLLKILEEPPENTLFFLVCEEVDVILPTIISRTQIIKIPNLKTEEVKNHLIKNVGVDKEAAQSWASLTQGNLVEALNMTNADAMDSSYFESFVKLMRAAYAIDAIALMDISETLAQYDRENQKNFLKYGLHMFRESLIYNYLGASKVNVKNDEKAFLDKFARFINNQNITALINEFDQSIYHIDRNANAKLLFSDLVIKLTKLIKKGV
ncbi:MAG: DNA polymerase III subunit delta' [Putridiphycobacter sp.]|nr:DNA polymerase III subunit delta' [Putridiphycobacter sp.]